MSRRIVVFAACVVSAVVGCGDRPSGSGVSYRPDAGAALRSAAPRADSAGHAPSSPPAADAPTPGTIPGGVPGDFDREAYDHVVDNDFLSPRSAPLSTFSIDVDTASYANVRRFLNAGQSPPPGAVRIEECVNYFRYAYPEPQGEVPFSVNVDVAGCPWTPKHRLVRIGLHGREIPFDQRPASNLVFLMDVSGSMHSSDKLPLVKSALRLLVEQLHENDRVAIVVYAGASGLVLPSTTGDRKAEILAALDRLEAGGSTNGGAGIELAYRTALEHFVPGGTNRVVLCTDGDFNVGVTNQSELVPLIEEKARSGVFLSVLGFGTGNYQDSTMEKLADKGNGNYAYLDTLREARKVLVEQAAGTLLTIAKDVKIQVDFNPAQVVAYRLVGYENRLLKAEDFQDDKKDAGEIGAGHTVTAFYEVVPVGVPIDLPGVDPSKYQPTTAPAEGAASDELLTVRLRYKQPDGDTSREIRVPLKDAGTTFDDASSDFQFAAAVAEFGLLLRNSPHKGQSNWPHVLEVAGAVLGSDPEGYRKEFVELAKQAAGLAKGR